MLTLQENHYYDQQNKLIIGNLLIEMKFILLVSHWKNQSVTVRAMITSWVSRPEFSASVLGNTRRALAKASTPSCARYSKFGHRDKRRQIRQLIDIWQLQMFQLKLINRHDKHTHTPWTVFFTSLIKYCLAATSNAPAPWARKHKKVPIRSSTLRTHYLCQWPLA